MREKSLVSHLGASLLAGLCLTDSLIAAGSDWDFSWNGEIYGYMSSMDLIEDSLLNPDNQIAQLPEKSASAEMRFNLKAEWEMLRMSMRPILLAQENRNEFDTWQERDAYLSQWQIRLQAAPSLGLSGGREVLNWGPGQFCSLASPFYFDNGRNNPLRELSGVDNLRLLWAPNRSQSLSATWITGSGHDQADIWRDTWLLKAEGRGDEWAGGLVASGTPGLETFAGLYGQYTVNDALLVYVEASSSTLPETLLSPSDETQPFRLESPSQRRTDALLGTSYTFDSGQSLIFEYIHYGHGYDAEEAEAYFDRAEASLLWATQALAFSPPILGQDYLYLVLQSNPLETSGYWRLMETHNLTDHSNKLSAYGEYQVSDSITAFAFAEISEGGVRQEFSSLYRSALTLGLKMALP